MLAIRWYSVWPIHFVFQAKASVKIGQFANAVQLCGGTDHVTIAPAEWTTPPLARVRHMAPEILEEGRFSEKSDVWYVNCARVCGPLSLSRPRALSPVPTLLEGGERERQRGAGLSSFIFPFFFLD